MAKEPNEVVLVSHIDPCIIITSRGVFKVKGGRMKRLLPNHLMSWTIKACWLSQALDKDFDPGEHRE